MEKKFERIFLVLDIMVFEPVAGAYLYYEENSCYRQSTSYQTVLRCQVWLREMFSNLILSWINRQLG